MRSVYLEKIEKEIVYLDPSECHHLTRVLRKATGYEFIGFDGKGARYRCCLEGAGKEWFGRIIEKLATNQESNLDLHLVQALVKKDRFEWILQKTVELGVSRISPVRTWRSELELDDKRMPKRLSRWEKIILEAVKQCGRNLIPVLDTPVDLRDFLNSHSISEGLVFDEEAETDLGAWFAEQDGKPASLTVLIGPEGGWDEKDRDLFQIPGITRVRLGPRILRTETAAITAVSILQYLCGDLSSST